jgi:hypothetical protein
MSEVSGAPAENCGVAEEPVVEFERVIIDEDEIPENGPWCIPLLMEGEGDVGSVAVVNNGDDFTVVYEVGEGWCLDSTQVQVGLGAGQELYEQDDFGECDTSAHFIVDGVADEDLYVAVTATMHQLPPEMDRTALDSFHGQVIENVSYPGGDSYFNTTISGDLTGTFDGFCVDTSRSISSGPTYNSNLWSSYDPNFPDVIGYEDEFDKVNYIINQDYVAQGYTYGDVQRAIWTVIVPKLSTSGLGSWSQSNVDTIVAEANANGEGFVPDCDGGVVAMVLQPVNSTGKTKAQVTIIEVPIGAIDGVCPPPPEELPAQATSDFVELFCE